MAEEGGAREGKGFKVQDRRRFSSVTGEPKEEVSGEGAPREAHRDEASRETAGPDKAAAGEQASEISFSAFVISLSTQALMLLGEIESPLSGKKDADLPAAKQLIDIIAVLREKTRGNLDSGEEKLLDEVLFDLRMRYVEAVKKK